MVPAQEPVLKLTTQITDLPGVLGPVEHANVDRALTKLHNERGTRLWVVYLNNFGDLKPFRWAEDTMRANGFADTDAILAVAIGQPAYSFRVPNAGSFREKPSISRAFAVTASGRPFFTVNGHARP